MHSSTACIRVCASSMQNGVSTTIIFLSLGYESERAVNRRSRYLKENIACGLIWVCAIM